MPLFQMGYRRYEGQRTPHWSRWWPITRTGFAIAWRSKLLRRLVYVSFLPLMYFGWAFFAIGKITDPGTDPNAPFFEVARAFFGSEVIDQLHEDPTQIRAGVWAILFATFGKVWQLVHVALVAAVVGPPLIANDLRSKAFLVYFARPVSRLDYIIGKACVLVGVLLLVTLVPSLALYAMSILFSPSFDTISQTLPVAIDLVIANVGTAVVMSLFLLTLSSLTRQARFATILWFGVWVFGLLTHLILSETRGLRDNTWTFLLSPFHALRAFQLGQYDIEERTSGIQFSGVIDVFAGWLSTSDSPARAALWLAFISIVCVFTLFRRVDAPTRI